MSRSTDAYKQSWKLLGRGGSGSAYLVEKKEDGAQQVIKKIEMAGLSDHESLQVLHTFWGIPISATPPCADTSGMQKEGVRSMPAPPSAAPTDAADSRA